MTTFSVISACKNQRDTIARCIDSIKAQSFTDFEHIIIDGDSQDGTKAIIESSKHPKLRWTSQIDSGIGEAMNKGIALASGTWLLFLHADDWLKSPNSLKIAQRCLVDCPAIVSFPIDFHEPNGIVRNLKNRGRCIQSYFKSDIGHQGAFIHRELFERLGIYDTKLLVTMDYDWFLRALHAKIPFYTYSETITCMGGSGLSSKRDWPSMRNRFEETKNTQLKNSQSRFLQVIYQFYWFLYLRLKFISVSLIRLKN